MSTFTDHPVIVKTTTKRLQGAFHRTKCSSCPRELIRCIELPQVVLLKNEFGDVEVDSELAKESAVEAVSEILSESLVFDP